MILASLETAHPCCHVSACLSPKVEKKNQKEKITFPLFDVTILGDRFWLAQAPPFLCSFADSTSQKSGEDFESKI